MDRNELIIEAYRETVAGLTHRVAELRAELTLTAHELARLENENKELKETTDEESA